MGYTKLKGKSYLSTFLCMALLCFALLRFILDGLMKTSIRIARAGMEDKVGKVRYLVLYVAIRVSICIMRRKII